MARGAAPGDPGLSLEVKGQVLPWGFRPHGQQDLRDAGCPEFSGSLLRHPMLVSGQVTFPFYSLAQTQTSWNTEHRPAAMQIRLSKKNISQFHPRLIPARTIYFFLSTRKKKAGRGAVTKILFLVNVLCSVAAIKPSENTISFEKKKKPT